MHRKHKIPFGKKNRGAVHHIKNIRAFPILTPVKKEQKINGFSFSSSDPTAVRGPVIDERRKHRRISMLATLDLALEGGFQHTGYAVNVSYGGISLYTKKALLADTNIQVQISFIDANGRDVFETISGSVVWCQPVGEWFGMGVQFKCIDPVKHPHLTGYLVRADRS